MSCQIMSCHRCLLSQYLFFFLKVSRLSWDDAAKEKEAEKGKKKEESKRKEKKKGEEDPEGKLDSTPKR